MPTKIEWTDETWNPITGCTKVSDGCKNCYAERMSKRLAGRFGYPADDPFCVTLHPDRLEQPLRWKKPRRVFVCSMGDLFHPWVTPSFVSQVFDVMQRAPQHTYQVLTKRPENLREWQEWSGFCLPNVHLGVSIATQEDADRYIRELLQTPAAVRFVSVEPMLESLNIWKWLDPASATWEETPFLYGLDWIIVGCESGPGRRPMELEWAIDLVGQCKAAGVACFVKQVEIDGKVSHDPDEWLKELQVREYPA